MVNKKCWKYGLTLSILGKKYSRQYFETCFLIFQENKVSHIMQIVICMKYQTLSYEKNMKKYYQFVVC